jgi:hypothetical protein
MTAMSDDPLDYQQLVQRALRGVMREAFEIVAEEGFPGGHHFYVSFDTGAPEVTLSPALRGKFPDEMTIVLQRQFWDLVADEWGFSVTLAFDGVRERLAVPWGAVRAFVDPEAQFALPFEGIQVAPGETDDGDGDGDGDDTPEAMDETVGGEGSGDPTADVVDIGRFRKDKS